MVDNARTEFRLRLGAVPDVEPLLRRFWGVEGLSELFHLDLSFLVPESALPHCTALLTSEVNLQIETPAGGQRWLDGICVRAEEVGSDLGYRAFRILVAPKLALLGERQNCRVFVQASVPEIVRTILAEHAIPFRDDLGSAYAKRELCVQYRESDLAFVSRLLEDEGITYWFQHGSAGHTMMLSDSGRFPALSQPDEVHLYPRVAGVPSEERLFCLRAGYRLRPGQSTLRDFDFRSPAVDLTENTGDANGLEVYDYPAGFLPQADLRRINRTRLEEVRADSQFWSGQGNCVRLAPGLVFRVREDSPEPIWKGSALTVRVEHQGRRQEETHAGPTSAADAYENDFLALPMGLRYRPPRRTRRPTIPGVQTATVICAGTEEIDPDRYGRIKIQFHWDREPESDTQLCAWVRPEQSWAGPGFGALFLPRVGQEVVVRFLEGNPDRPLIAGAVYNGNHVPPIELPVRRTQSTLRTQSSPGGHGSNEVRFDDAAHAEKIHWHAQKDEKIEVITHKTQKVRGHEQLRVGGDRRQTVLGNQDLHVRRDGSSRIDGDQRLTVHQHRTTTVGGDHSEKVVHAQTVNVAQTRQVVIGMESNEIIGADAALTVGEAHSVNVGGVSVELVGGDKSVQVQGDRLEQVMGEREESIAQKSDCTTRGKVEVDIGGYARRTANGALRQEVGGTTEVQVAEAFSVQTKQCRVEADRLTLVVAGQAVLSMHKSGVITIDGRNVLIDGADIGLKGSSQICKSSPGSAGSEAAQIRQAGALDVTGDFVHIALVDEAGDPVPNEPYTIELPDGTLAQGATDASGQARVPSLVSGQCRVSFPRLDGSTWDEE